MMTVIEVYYEPSLGPQVVICRGERERRYRNISEASLSRLAMYVASHNCRVVPFTAGAVGYVANFDSAVNKLLSDRQALLDTL